MLVKNNSYNVLTIEIEDDLTAGTEAVIGTNLDYEMIKKMTAKSGILRVKATIGGNSMFGTMNVNPSTTGDMLECTCVTYYGNGTKAIVGQLVPSDDGMKATVSLYNLANS